MVEGKVMASPFRHWNSKGNTKLWEDYDTRGGSVGMVTRPDGRRSGFILRQGQEISLDIP